MCVCVTAGYNNLEVAEYLLLHGAEVNSQDKGGLIPLHNAASYGVCTHTHTSLNRVKKKKNSDRITLHTAYTDHLGELSTITHAQSRGYSAVTLMSC